MCLRLVDPEDFSRKASPEASVKAKDCSLGVEVHVFMCIPPTFPGCNLLEK